MVQTLIECWKKWKEEGDYPDEEGILPQSLFEDAFEALVQAGQLDAVMPLALVQDGPVVAGHLFHDLLQQSESLIEEINDQHVDTQLFVVPFHGKVQDADAWMERQDWAETMIEANLIHPSSSVAILGVMGLQQAFQIPLMDLQRWLCLGQKSLENMQGFTLYGPALQTLRQSFQSHAPQIDPWGQYVLVGIRQTVKDEALYAEEGFEEGLMGEDTQGQAQWCDQTSPKRQSNLFDDGPIYWTEGLLQSLFRSLTPCGEKTEHWSLSSETEGLVIRGTSPGFEKRVLPHAIAHWTVPFLLSYWIDRGDELHQHTEGEVEPEMEVLPLSGNQTFH